MHTSAIKKQDKAWFTVHCEGPDPALRQRSCAKPPCTLRGRRVCTRTQQTIRPRRRTTGDQRTLARPLSADCMGAAGGRQSKVLPWLWGCPGLSTTGSPTGTDHTKQGTRGSGGPSDFSAGTDLRSWATEQKPQPWPGGGPSASRPLRNGQAGP